MAVTSPQAFLRRLFEAGVQAADPMRCLAPYLPDAVRGRTIVIGAGKAAASMARAVELARAVDLGWSGRQSEFTGLVVTRYGHGVACDRIEVVEAGHPVPDAAGEAAARRIFAMVSDLSRDDLVLFLISGGGSALLSIPAQGLSLDDKQEVNRALLKSGASISQMNCLRKHLSMIKGGRLARAIAPARLVTLAISDVPGDDPSVIASGPTVPDTTTAADALAVLDYYNIGGAAVRKHLTSDAAETPKPGDECFANTHYQLIATPQASLEAAARFARNAGVTPVIIGDAIEGEAREVARVHAGVARQIARHGQPAPAPAVLLSGGETTVTVRGTGRGGRNAEFALALALDLDGLPGVFALAADTDGIDGTQDNAGAVVTPDTLARARSLGLESREMLDNNDGYSFFEALDDLVKTGPTLTNVNDFRAIYIPGRQRNT